jgi:Glycolipid transfer protein (GLTP)
MSGVFNYDNLMNHLQKASENLEDIHFYHFSEAMQEFSNSFAFLGMALSMAFSDITTKARAIQDNFKNLSITGLQTMIREEIRRGVERNNDKSSPSTARTVLRLLWFFDFLKEIITNVLNNPAQKLSDACSEAYSVALAPHHPWHVRMAAKLGIKTVPSKEEYLNRLIGPMPLEKQLDLFRTMLEASTPIREKLWQFYNENRLTDLP